MEVIQKLWAADGRISHHGKHYQFDDVRITPKPMQKPMPAYIGSFSKPSIELAARLGYGLIVAPFAAAMSYGGLKQVADLYNETCVKHGKKPGRLMCSYFTHFYDNKAQEDAARARQIRYYKECVIPALPGDPKTAPPSYTYFVDMVERLHKVQPEQLTENSVLLGNSQQITDTLKKVEAAGFSEVILYFNVGMKPHARSRRRWTASCARWRRTSRASTSSGARREPAQDKNKPRSARQSGAFRSIASPAGNLVDDLDDAPRAELDQHRTVVDDGVAISRRCAVFRRHVIVGHAALRQHDADAKILVVAIGRPPLANHVFAKARAIVDTQDAADRAGCGADRAANDGAERSGSPSTFRRAFFRASHGALRLRRHRQRQRRKHDQWHD